MIPSGNCYNSIMTNLKFLCTTKAKTPLIDTACDMVCYMLGEKLKKLDGTPLRKEDLPVSEYYYFYEWSVVLAFDASTIQQAEDFLVKQNAGSSKVCFIKVNAYDAKTALFGGQ